MNTKTKALQISQNAKVIDAIKAIDQGGKQVTFVVDDSKRLIGSVSDGDIRRALLKGTSLEASVKEVAQSSPIYATEAQAKHGQLLDIMKQHKIHQLPIVDDNMNIMRIETLDDLLAFQATSETWVVLMAGGLGTRLRPLTDDTPKPMLPVGGRPLLESIILNFREQGFRKFYLSVNYKAEIVQDHFGDGSDLNVQIHYLHETKRLGTAGALSLLPEEPTSNLIVMNGDLLTSVNFNHLLDFHEENKAVATICAREYSYQIPYGVLQTDGTSLTKIAEKPQQRFLVNSGIYVVSPDALKIIPEDSFFDMPQLFEKLIEENRRSAVFPIHEYWLDIGKFDDLEKAQNEFHQIFMKQVPDT